MAERPIDEKIVVMKLENSDFKRKVKETSSIFERMKSVFSRSKPTAISGMTNEIKDLNKAAGKVDLSNIGLAADRVASRFSNMGVIATTALTNITNRAVDAGLRLQKSLTTDQIFSGFNEYELKMRSIQTILSNTEWMGTDLDDVKNALGELNDYADKTIYSFAEMTSSIGRFTAAGASLENATVAIKGMGNLAAASGAGVEQLNRAMYQASQALAGGVFQLIDWNSIEEAGMGGKKTKDALMDTAEAMGINIDRSKTFRETLKDGWLTSEVFLETMKKFGNDESMIEAATTVRTFTGMMDALKESIGSGWATTWELIFGDFEEATRFWTTISNAVGGFFEKQTNARNDMIQSLLDSGALNTIGSILENTIMPFVRIFQTIKGAFTSVFPPEGPGIIMGLATGIATLTSNIKLSTVAMDSIRTIFVGVASIVLLAGEAFKFLGNMVAMILPGVGSIGEGFLTLLAHIFKIPTAMAAVVSSGEAVSGEYTLLGKIFSTIGAIIGAVVAGVSNLAAAMVDLFRSIDISGIGQGVLGFFTSIKDGAISLKDAIFGIDDWFKNLWNVIADNQGWILASGGAVGLAAVLWKVWEIIEAITKPLIGFGDILENAGDALGAFTFAIHARTLVTIAIAVGLLAASFWALSGLDTAQITTGLYMIVGSLSAVIGALFLMTKYSITGGFGATLTIMGMAAALLIMSKAIDSMKNISWEQMSKGIVGVVALMGALAGAMILISKFGPSIAISALQIVAMTGSIYILAVSLNLMRGAIDKMAQVDFGVMIKGLGSIAAILLVIGGFGRLAAGTGLLASAVGIMVLSQALKMMVSPIEKLASINIKVLAKGIGTIAVMLAAVAAASYFAGGVIAMAAGIAILAVAFNMLVKPIGALGAMDMPTLAKGLGAIVSAIGLIAAASMLLAPAAIPVIAFAAAISLLGLGMAAFGGGVALLAMGLTTLAGLGSVAIVAVVATLGSLVTGISTLIPAAVDLMLKLFDAVVNAFEKMTPTIQDSITKFLITLMDKLEENVPKLMEKGADLMLAILEGWETYAPMVLSAIVNTGTHVILEFMKAIENNLSLIVSTGSRLINDFIDGFENEVPQTVARIAEFVVNLVKMMSDTVRTNGPLFTAAVLELMGEILIVIADAGSDVIRALFGWIPGVSEAMTNLSTNAESVIRKNFNAAGAGKDKGEEFAEGVMGADGVVYTAGEAIAISGRDGASSVDTSSAGAEFGAGFEGGIWSKIRDVRDAAFSMASAAYNAITERLDINSPSRETHIAGMDTANGMAGGLKQGSSSVVEAIFGWIPGVKKSVEEVGKTAQSTASKESTKAVEQATAASNKAISKSTSSTTKAVNSSISKTSKSTAKTAKQKAEEAAKKVRDAFNAELDDLKYKLDMEEIDEVGYLSGLKEIRKNYSKHLDILKEMNLKVKQQQDKVDDEAAKKEEDRLRKIEDDRRDAFNKDKEQIQDLKDYNKVSLKDELKYWESIMGKYAKGTDERKEAEKEVYRLKNELTDKMNQINEDYVDKVKQANAELIQSEKEVNDEYDNAYKSRYERLKSFAGLFEKIQNDSNVTGTELIENLRSQVDTLRGWAHDMSELETRGLSDGLLEELRELGPSSHAEVAALLTLTEDQLKEYNNLWLNKDVLAHAQTTKELEQLRKDSDAKIHQLREDTKKQLEEYAKEWQVEIKKIRYGVEDEFVALEDKMPDMGKSIVQKMIDGMSGMSGALSSETKKLAETIMTTIQNTLQIKSLGLSTDSIGLGMSNSVSGSNVVYSGSTVRASSTASPNLNYSTQTLSATRASTSSTSSQNDNKNTSKQSSDPQVAETLALVKDLSSRPNVHQLVVDGSVLAEVVDEYQTENLNNKATYKGVTLG